MIGEVASPPWLEVNWILSQFSKQRKTAIRKYINFVREGVAYHRYGIILKIRYSSAQKNLSIKSKSKLLKKKN